MISIIEILFRKYIIAIIKKCVATYMLYCFNMYNNYLISWLITCFVYGYNSFGKLSEAIKEAYHMTTKPYALNLFLQLR